MALYVCYSKSNQWANGLVKLSCSGDVYHGQNEVTGERDGSRRAKWGSSVRIREGAYITVRTK